MALWWHEPRMVLVERDVGVGVGLDGSGMKEEGRARKMGHIKYLQYAKQPSSHETTKQQLNLPECESRCAGE